MPKNVLSFPCDGFPVLLSCHGPWLSFSPLVTGREPPKNFSSARFSLQAGCLSFPPLRSSSLQSRFWRLPRLFFFFFGLNVDCAPLIYGVSRLNHNSFSFYFVFVLSLFVPPALNLFFLFSPWRNLEESRSQIFSPRRANPRFLFFFRSPLPPPAGISPSLR